VMTFINYFFDAARDCGALSLSLSLAESTHIE
jgi:hypothetical protein